MGLIDVYRNGQKVGQIAAFKGEKGDSLTYDMLTTEQKADLRGIANKKVTESEYAAITPESGVLYIVTADT